METLEEEKKKNLRRLWGTSRWGDVAAVRALLEGGNVDINGFDEWDGWAAIHYASSNGHLSVVELLLKAGAAPNSADKNGETPLHQASLEGHLAVVEVLLKAGADLNAANKDGSIPLHLASSYGHLPIVELLVKTVQDPNVANKKTGETPLHYACESAESDVVRALLALGADLHSEDNDGYNALHHSLQPSQYSFGRDLTAKTPETLQVLVSFGATWDTKCDELVSSGKARDEAPALRICMLLWSQELADGLSFTEIPLEVIERGADSTQVYIDDLKNSVEVVLRRKICLVGCGCAGKTSLVKSIISEQPQLEHVDDRSIGIDHFSLSFSESATGSGGKRKTHKVTFWDFAGQDAYQVAHSLFFSPRTLYLVCVDLEAITTTFLQASIMANVKKQETQLMNEFIERTVMHWIRMIIARQPDAEFQFIATKEDLLAENQVTGKLLKDHLKLKLAEVETTVRAMKRKDVEEGMESAHFSGAATAEIPKHSGVLFVNCTSVESTQDARRNVEELIIKSDRCFQMPDTYSHALAEIVRMREAAKRQDITTRISRVFASVDSLPAELNMDPEQCRTILQTLHDLGDVLWYEDLGVDLFEDTVILDPLLLIDFIRQVITHKHTGVTISHADLTSKRFWLGLSIPQMKAMKQLLQKFRLVYATASTRIMEWNSDLTVPAFWQTKEPASWKFGWDDLRINKTRTLEGEAVRIKWEYIFEVELPPALFDHVVVASVSPHSTFEAGPDWILYEEKEVAACRIMVCRDSKSLHQTIQIEAVVAEAATTKQVKTLWRSFESQCGAFVSELRSWPGLKGVSSFAYNDKQTRINMLDLLVAAYSDSEWMPPEETWKWFKRLVSQPATIRERRVIAQRQAPAVPTRQATVTSTPLESAAATASQTHSHTAAPFQLSDSDSRPTDIEPTPPVSRGFKKWKNNFSKWMR